MHPADVVMICYWMILLLGPAALLLLQILADLPILLMYAPVILPFLICRQMFLPGIMILYINGSLVQTMALHGLILPGLPIHLMYARLLSPQEFTSTG